VGQKKIKLIDLSQEAQPAYRPASPNRGEQAGSTKKEAKKTKEVKGEKISGKKVDAKDTKITGSKAAKKEVKSAEEVRGEKISVKAAKKPRAKKQRSRRYRKLKTLIDRKKLYPLAEGVKLLCQIANSKIDETVEVNLISREEKLSGTVSLPHGTGKKQKIAIADDRLIDTINKGKIDFDILIAEPKMMAKIAKVAKILGPKGLMPNPKAGTITDKPEALKKKLEKGELRFKTEQKTPLLHIIIGKISFGEKKLMANLEALIEAVKSKNIKKAVLTSTHSPGIKLDIKEKTI